MKIFFEKIRKRIKTNDVIKLYNISENLADKIKALFYIQIGSWNGRKDSDVITSTLLNWLRIHIQKCAISTMINYDTMHFTILLILYYYQKSFIKELEFLSEQIEASECNRKIKKEALQEFNTLIEIFETLLEDL